MPATLAIRGGNVRLHQLAADPKPQAIWAVRLRPDHGILVTSFGNVYGSTGIRVR